jgi:hypothetical protein
VKTTSRDIIETITRTLRQRVLPAMGDPGVAADLREINTQLDALAVRIECEGEIIWNDIADQRLMLAAIAQETGHLPAPNWSGLAAEITKELDRVWHTPAHYPALAVLQAENRRLRALIDKTLATAEADPAPLGERRAQRLVKALHGYMKRQADREAPLHAPDAGGS